jgi:outer membrane protein
MTGRISFLIIICLLAGMSIAAPSFAADEYSLHDLYRIALKKSERIKISEEDLFISSKGKDKAVSALLPKLSAFSSYTRYSEDKQSASGSIIQPDSSGSYGLRLDQSITLNGREITGLDIAKESIGKSRHDLDAVRESYIFGVASAFYDALKAVKSVDIAKSNAERLKKHRDAAAVRLKVGEVTKTALLRAEAELSGANSDLVKAENILKLAKAALARTAGIEGDFILKEGDGSYAEKDLAAMTAGCENVKSAKLQCFKQKASDSRPELKSLSLQEKIAGMQIKYSEGSLWPTISIEGVYSRKDESPASAFLNKESVYAGLKFNFPFFEGGLRKAEISEAEAKKRQAELAYEDSRKTIFIDVENAWLDLQTQKDILKSLGDQVSFAKDNYNAVTRQFGVGLASSIDVMDANNLLVTSERRLSEAWYGYLLSIQRLKRVTGTLLTGIQ